jgi:hypothetical protein
LVFTACAPKASEVGVMLAVGPVPVPLRETVCGLVGSESTRDKVAVRVPVADGWKITLMVQLVPADSVAPQVVVSA